MTSSWRRGPLSGQIADICGGGPPYIVGPTNGKTYECYQLWNHDDIAFYAMPDDIQPWRSWRGKANARDYGKDPEQWQMVHGSRAAYEAKYGEVG